MRGRRGLLNDSVLKDFLDWLRTRPVRLYGALLKHQIKHKSGKVSFFYSNLAGARMLRHKCACNVVEALRNESPWKVVKQTSTVLAHSTNSASTAAPCTSQVSFVSF